MASNRGFLLDTQIFIWWMEKSPRLSNELLKLLNDPQDQILLSVASVWEMVIKKGKKKLKTPKDIEGGIKASGFSILPIEISHVLAVEKLPLYHKDPFDRVLVAQAQAENLTLITSDQKIWKYSINILKC